jgi:hypothetical protein
MPSDPCLIKMRRNLMMKPCLTLLKRKHSSKGEKKKQEARTKVQASKQPKRGGLPEGKGTTKNRTLHE